LKYQANNCYKKDDTICNDLTTMFDQTKAIIAGPKVLEKWWIFRERDSVPRLF
jgi:hypothetical protein